MDSALLATVTFKERFYTELPTAGHGLTEVFL